MGEREKEIHIYIYQMFLVSIYSGAETGQYCAYEASGSLNARFTHGCIPFVYDGFDDGFTTCLVFRVLGMCMRMLHSKFHTGLLERIPI